MLGNSTNQKTVIHLEDKDEWQDKVKQCVERALPDWEYRPISEGDVSRIVSDIGKRSQHTIVVVDLGLGRMGSADKTVVSLLAALKEVHHSDKVIVLTGLMNDDRHTLLTDKHISSANIFEKKHWGSSSARFEVALRNIALSQNRHRLLHFSDIHFGQQPGSAETHADIRNQALHDVADLRSSRGNIDTLLVSGDIAFSGKTSEYQLASDWIAKAIQSCGCHPDRVFVVPGNHDVDLDLTGEEAKTYLNDVNTAEDDKLAETIDAVRANQKKVGFLRARLMAFREFAAQYGPQHINRNQADWSVPLVKWSGLLELHLVGLTSVLLSKGKDDYGRLVLLPNPRGSLAERAGIEYVVMMHHPPNWYRNRREITQLLEARARVCLSGHEHEARIEVVKNAGERVRLQVFAGALDESLGDWSAENYNYNWIEIYPAVTVEGGVELVVDLLPRKWHSAAMRFQQDFNLATGHAILRSRLPTSLKSPS